MDQKKQEKQEDSSREVTPRAGDEAPTAPPVEHGGAKGPEPTRYGDWEKNGRCTDF